MKGDVNINNFKGKILYIFTAVTLILGLCSILYPIVSAVIADYTSTKVITDYQAQVENMQEKEIQKQKEYAAEFNKKLSTIVIDDPIAFFGKTDDKNKSKKSVSNQKTVFKEGEIEGYIDIPKINVNLPIYEGTKENVLYKGAGHLKTSSLPFGGKGTHCVITGHNGLSTATLFSNLEKIKKGDVFYIHFFDEIHKYKVDSINTVKPDNSDDYIKIEKNKDYCTLITCVPKTVNTHRLLVRGIRVPYDDSSDDRENEIIEKQEKQNISIVTFIILCSIILIIIAVIVIKRVRKNVF